MPVENIDDSKCVGCGTCVATCSMDVFRMDKSTSKATIAYQEDCQICHLCRICCPQDAITITPQKSLRPMTGWG
jgi:NAD-dependent dihydropyrimidine dehydrogenase PreA subunit